MLGLLCLSPTASPVGKPRPAGLVLGPGSTPYGSQGACSPGSTRNARHHRGLSALPQDRPLKARKSLLSCDSDQGVASFSGGPKPAESATGADTLSRHVASPVRTLTLLCDPQVRLRKDRRTARCSPPTSAATTRSTTSWRSRGGDAVDPSGSLSRLSTGALRPASERPIRVRRRPSSWLGLPAATPFGATPNSAFLCAQ
jgi:hypothetical protein